MLRVLKFGGSSLSDLAAIEQVADRIARAHRAGDQLVVVCSAMGSATDDLLALAARTAPGASGRELDMLVTAGERVAAALLSLRLGHIGVPAWSLTGSQSGIVTDGAHGQARILAIRPHRVRAGLAEQRVVVVAGFQGVSEAGEVTTLARGGSDTTAVALAAALGADACEIYSDVDGIYAADPRWVTDARHLPALDLDSMQALADGGAQVLAAEAVAFARRAGIAIDAAHANGSPKRTRIEGAWRPSAAPLAAVTSCRALWRGGDGGSTPGTTPAWAQPWALLWASPQGLLVRRPDGLSRPGDEASLPPWQALAAVTLVARPSAQAFVAPVLAALAPLPNARWLSADGTRALFVVNEAHEAEAVRRAHAALKSVAL